jgi:hypothetical protein
MFNHIDMIAIIGGLNLFEPKSVYSVYFYALAFVFVCVWYWFHLSQSRLSLPGRVMYDLL